MVVSPVCCFSKIQQQTDFLRWLKLLKHNSFFAALSEWQLTLAVDVPACNLKHIVGDRHGILLSNTTCMISHIWGHLIRSQLQSTDNLQVMHLVRRYWNRLANWWNLLCYEQTLYRTMPFGYASVLLEPHHAPVSVLKLMNLHSTLDGKSSVCNML